MAKIGVQTGLSDVEQELQSMGHDVVQVSNEEEAQGCDCCVMSGRDPDVAGVSPQGDMSIVSADGLTAQEIGERVEQSLNHQQG